MSEENKVTARRFFDDVVNGGDLDLIDEQFAEDLAFHMPFSPEPLSGPGSVKLTIAGLRGAFSDFKVVVEDLIAEGDIVVARLTASGTNDGELMGLPATNRPASWSVIHVMKFQDGKIVEDRVQGDRMGLMEQLGHIQPPG
jgi:steroid delta-isomerase-like uncharacterized protein